MLLALLALAPAAQAAITGTGNFGNPPRSESGGDWTATGNWHALGGGTITVAGGSQVDMAGYILTMGWSSDETITVTGTGSKFLSDQANGVSLGQNVHGGIVVVEDGGWFDATGTDRAFMLSLTGPGTALVTGAGSKLTTLSGSLVCGMYNNLPGTVTVEDSGLVQTKSIILGFDPGGEGYIHMGVGGVLAVFGEKATINDMFTVNGSSTGEIQYNPSGDGTTWVNMTLAPASAYTLTYSASGPTVNGQDLNGYTVLTMAGGTPPVPSGTVIMFK
jgi:T5SS/PEP-CTERM-associated repeat protein